MSGHLLRRVVKILKTMGRRHEEVQKPKGPILRLWAPKVAFTKACSGGWRSGHKLRRKKQKTNRRRFHKGLFKDSDVQAQA